MIENLKEIKERANIEAVLKDLGIDDLKSDGSGNELGGSCPLVSHSSGDKCGFSINLTKKMWNCFACSDGGDIIDLIKKVKDNISMQEAAEILAKTSGTDVKKYTPAKKTDLWIQTKRTPQEIIKDSELLVNHPYFNKKHVELCSGLYHYKDKRENDPIVVPFKDINDEIKTVQFIPTAGNKLFLNKPYTYIGAFFKIGDFKDGDQIYLAEGLATALTIWMAYDKKITVVSFGSANNMKHVVDVLSKEFPNLKMIICLDDNNAAYKQALKLENPRCSFRIPSFDEFKYEANEEQPSDFNDIISKCSSDLKEVRKQLEVEKSLQDIPGIEKIPSKQTVTLHDSTLTIECQKDLINYLLKRSLTEILSDGFDPEEHFSPYLFTGINHTVIEAIIKTWEQGVDVTKNQVSLNSEQAEIIYNYLNQFDNKLPINASQVNERINKLRDDYAKRKLNKSLIEAQESKKPLNEIIEQLHKDTEIIRGEAEVVLSQKQYLAIFESELNNPTKNVIIKTGFKSIDRLLGGGFIKTELGVLTGGAGAGKSAFALQIADNVAKGGACVVYYSIEIPKRKLTERSYKRLSGSSKLTPEAIEKAYKEYEKFAENIFLIKGRSGMLLSEIKGKVLNIRRQKPGQAILLIIDPFQRLGTGRDNVDYGNETAKVGQLVSDIKQMAEDLDIPILAISDTIKEHKNSSDGEGNARGSYMINHTCDYMMYLRQSRDPSIALYGTRKEGKATVPNVPDKDEDPFAEKIKNILDTDYKYKKDGKFALNSDWDKYASLQTSKVRDNGKFSPLLIYKPALHSFEDTDLWDKILPKD